MRAPCGCLIDGGMVLHGFDGPCSDEPTSNEPTEEDYCAADGHAYEGDDHGVGRCHCGRVTYPAGGPGGAA